MRRVAGDALGGAHLDRALASGDGVTALAPLDRLRVRVDEDARRAHQEGPVVLLTRHGDEAGRHRCGRRYRSGRERREGIGRRGSASGGVGLRYHPTVPGPPLNGPATRDVTQLP